MLVYQRVGDAIHESQLLQMGEPIAYNYQFH